MNERSASDFQERAIILGEYIIENKSTVRAAAKQFGISKSTVHKDVAERLPKIQPQLYPLVKQVLEKNKQERHIRGGMATKRKYEQLAVIHKKAALEHQQEEVKK
ncbi:MAG: sporulation transcriptional regulator SpoIIID [Oscillospiraceae bacterium]|nr:sporulation transcriptional regulator SpoIIID [Oscillospiraceae bacterium]